MVMMESCRFLAKELERIRNRPINPILCNARYIVREGGYEKLEKALPLFCQTIRLTEDVYLATMGGEDIVTQILLCTPAITAFTVAASIALRRNGFTKTGFFIQFAGPVLFFVPAVLESIIVNFFG